MLSVQKKLSPCPIGLHESWVPQAAKFKQVIVSVAFMTMRNELLLKQDASGKFVLPSEHFPASDLLLSAPLRVLIQNFGSRHQEMLDVRPGRKVKVLGWQCEEGGNCDILMMVPVVRLLMLHPWYVKDFAELASRVANPDSPAFVAAKALGWRQRELKAA